MNRRPQNLRDSANPRDQGRYAKRRGRTRNPKRGDVVERYKDHQTAVDRERHAREAVLAVKRSRFARLTSADALAAAAGG